jgi:hypothetical protein
VEVIIMRPWVRGNRGYIIVREEPVYAFATQDGKWVDFLTNYRGAAQFAQARHAIRFAEAHDWTVKNKRNANSLIDTET